MAKKRKRKRRRAARKKKSSIGTLLKVAGVAGVAGGAFVAGKRGGIWKAWKDASNKAAEVAKDPFGTGKATLSFLAERRRKAGAKKTARQRKGLSRIRKLDPKKRSAALRAFRKTLFG